MAGPAPTDTRADAPRIGTCCTFVDPDGEADSVRPLNFRGPTVASIARAEDSAERLHAVIRDNLDILDRQVARMGALPRLERLFRIQSGFLIGWSHPALAAVWTPGLRAEVAGRLARSGEAARRADLRLSMHPAQHAILATLNSSALDNAVRDIEEHGEIFAMLGFSGGWHPHGASVNIHGGARGAGVEGIRHGLTRLSAQARNLLTIENDETSFGLDDLLHVADEVAIVLDFHHHWVMSGGEWILPGDPRIAGVAASWRGVRPLAHISVSRETVIPGHDPLRLPDFAALAAAGHKASKLRGHSDMMWNGAVNDFVAAHLAWTDVEVEAKAKNLAAAQLADHVRALAGADA
ncbi:UV damage endonuclease UvsE [Sphingomonas sabuli]|uniref:UV damage endonuclease UvsE n=1 Tax=Sphingomonas sabuli TaxID=2764186 RepID=A0A7G9L0M2_9SPHN|nr:UV damage endonuclease UvsE [Sphingomonas sabuli]QNM82171.1 UV damage endonuclease UvsE [Sphingomonas sabuli]